MKKTRRYKKLSKCEWFLLCDNDAVKKREHPILVEVPICKRCDALVTRQEKANERTGR